MAKRDKSETQRQTEKVEQVRAFFKFASEATDKQRQREADDLRFQIPDKEHQWEESVRDQLKGQTIGGIAIPPQPMLCVSTLDEPIQLQLNQEKAAHLGIEIHPLTEDATDDTAKVLQGLYRNIEVTSRAHLARSWGFDRSLKAGRGVYRVLTEYDPYSDVPGDQRIIIKRILFQESAFFDPLAEEPDFSDGEEAGLISAMSEAKFKRKYPKSKVADFELSDWTDSFSKWPAWFTEREDGTKVVMVGEYWKVTHDDKTITEKNWKGEDVQVPDPTNRPHVSYCKSNGVEILEEQELPGRYIPLIPTIGRELQPVDGERHWLGMIRPAKDGARLTNYAASKAVKMAALEPEAPWMMEEGQDEGHPEWKAPHLPWPVMKYRRIGLSGMPGEAPKRIQVDVSRLGPSVLLLERGKEFVNAATMTFPPALGENTPAHRSGKAIQALQGQTIAGNSNYLDNEAQITLPYEALVILDWIPYVYDRPGRVVRILDENDKPQSVMLNQAHTMDPNTKRPVAFDIPPGADPRALAADQTNPIKHYDLNKGRYGVSVRIGKASADRLQAGEDAMSRIIEAAPELMQVIGPEFMKFQDNPAAQAVQKILQKNRDHTMPWLRDDPQQGPDPQQLAAENQALKQQLEMAAKAIETKQIETEGKFKIAAMQESAESQRAAADREVKLAVAELGAKVDRLTLFMEERARLGVQAHEENQAAQDRAHDAALGAQEHAHTLEQGDQAHGQALVQAAHAQAIAPEPTDNGSGAA